MRKHSINIMGHPTSVTLEDEFWDALKTIADRKNKSLNALIAQIDAARGSKNLSSAIRVFVLKNVSNPTV